MMIDRSLDLVSTVNRLQQNGLSATNGNGVRERTTVKEKGNQAFLTGSVYISKELDNLAKSVAFFTKESQKRRLFEDSGTSLTHGSEGIRKKLDTLSKGIQGLDKIIANNNSRQLSKHYTIILDTLKKRFAGLAKSFQENLQQRAKTMSDRQAMQANQFGATRVQLSTPEGFRSPATGIGGANPRPRPGGFSQPPIRSPSTLNQTPSPSPPQIGGGIRRRGGPFEHHQQQPPTSFNAPPPPLPPSSMAPSSPYNPYGGNAAAYGQSKKDDGASAIAMDMDIQKYDRQSIAQRRRAIETQNVESMITEVSQMFSKVATMVAEQGDTIERIDQDIDTSLSNVQAGQNELLKYYNNLSSERQFILKIFLVTICLAVFFIVFW